MNFTEPFSHEPDPQYIYQQYRDDVVIKKFFEAIDNLKKKWYYGETLAKMWEGRDLKDTESDYMYFYSRYYLGFIRPVKSDPKDLNTEYPPELMNQWDMKMVYDRRFIWDAAGIHDPEMSIGMFKIVLGMVYDYSYETWTHDLMIRYISEMCNINPNDVKIEFRADKVIYWVISTQQCRAFIEYTKQDKYKMNLPFGDVYEIKMGDHQKNTNPYDEFMLGYNRPDTWQKAPEGEPLVFPSELENENAGEGDDNP